VVHVGSYGRHNHSCTISPQLVHRLGSYGNPNFPISYTAVALNKNSSYHSMKLAFWFLTSLVRVKPQVQQKQVFARRKKAIPDSHRRVIVVVSESFKTIFQIP